MALKRTQYNNRKMETQDEEMNANCNNHLDDDSAI